MAYPILVVPLLLALLDWLAIAKGWRWLDFLAKPGTILALLAWLLIAGGLQGNLVWFALGVFFSLAGDIFLMFPNERLILGLFAFLLAHLAYIIGFNVSIPPINFATMILTFLVVGTSAQMYRLFSPRLRKEETQHLKIPIIAYLIVISLMVLSALLTLVHPIDEWLVTPAMLVSAGALLFYLSDAFLVYNRFVTPLAHARLKVMITYHLAQIAIISGAVLNFTNLMEMRLGG